MNKERRKAIDALRERIENIQNEINEIEGEIESVRDEEQEYFDNMPESFQSGDKGQAAEAAIEQLDGALESIQEIGNLLTESAANLETAQE